MDYIWWVSATAQLLVVCRFLSLGLGAVKRYPVFLCFLTANLLRSGVLLQHERASKAYLQIWVSTEPILLLLMLFAAVEALRRTLEAYPGRRDAFSILLLLFSSGAFAFLLLTSGLDSDPRDRWGALHLIAVARRALTGSLAIFLMGASLWLHWLPVSERENVRLHRRIMTVYFGSAGVAQLAINIGLDRAYANTGALAASIVCYCAWLFVSVAGEKEPDRVVLTAEEIERLDDRARGYRRLLR